MRQLLLAALLAIAAATTALAVNPDEILADPALEARARAISANLRCLVCQNQSIDDSDAELARDLRIIVRERLTAGDSDAAAMQHVVDRYGEFVLLNPVVATHTIVLWVAAPVILLVGGIVVLLGARRRSRRVEPAGPIALSEEEVKALEELEGRKG
ncbi:MAG: cytochrome c-type biogenesis protein CcmH [Devosia sp.]|nr:cytochrome c-type biogenesis protein CcmH [Devosia sp.]